MWPYRVTSPCGLFRSIIFTLISAALHRTTSGCRAVSCGASAGSSRPTRHRGEWIENGGLRPAVFFQRSAVATLGLECRTRILGASLEIPFVDIEQGRLQTRPARWSSRRLLLPIVPPCPIHAKYLHMR